VAYFTASLPTPGFVFLNGGPGLINGPYTFSNGTNRYLVTLDSSPYAQTPNDDSLLIYKSSDQGHTWANIVTDINRGASARPGIRCCQIGTVIYILAVNANGYGFGLWLFRFDMATDTFLADDGLPGFATYDNVVMCPWADGSLFIARYGVSGGGTGVDVMNWNAGVWGTFVNVPASAGGLYPLSTVKEKLTERIHLFAFEVVAGPASGYLWHISFTPPTTANVPQTIYNATRIIRPDDTGIGLIKGNDEQVLFPFRVGVLPADEISSVHVLRGTCEDNPTWTDETVWSPGTTPYASQFRIWAYPYAAGVDQAGRIYLLFPSESEQPYALMPLPNVRASLWETHTDLLVGGWSAPVSIFDLPLGQEIAAIYPVKISDTDWGAIIGAYNTVTFTGPNFKDSLYVYYLGQQTPIQPLSIICDNPPSGQVGVAYSHTFPTSGGTPPYTFSILAGVLPPGLTLDPATGIVSGTPTAAGTYPFIIQVVSS